MDHSKSSAIRWSAYDHTHSYVVETIRLSYTVQVVWVYSLRFTDKASYLSEVANFNLPHLHSPAPIECHQDSWRQNLELACGVSNSAISDDLQ